MDILFLLLIVLLTLSIPLIIRNSKVYEFVINLSLEAFVKIRNYLNSCDEYLTDEEWVEYVRQREIVESIYDISYSKLLFSFKPLEKEYWLTQEQIDFLNDKPYNTI